MHALHIFATGLALSAASANAISNQGKACSSAMKVMPFAGVQTFCSSFLHIQTSTIRTTATSTQKLITTTSTTVFTTPTSTATSSPSTTSTVLETTTPHTRITITPSTTSTSTLSVTQVDTLTETAPAVTVTSSAMARVKRSLDMGPIFKLFAGPVVSEACSALVANPSPKTTTTLKATQTVYTGTSTITSIITAEPQTVTSTLDIATETTTQIKQASLITDTDTAAEETSYETVTASTTIYTTATVTPTVTVSPLPGPPPVLRNPVELWNAQDDVDDETKPITLPFPMTLFGQSSTSIWVSTNALLGLGSANWAYTNNPFPQALSNAPVIAALWDDLYIYSGTTQNIYYEIDGNTVTIEYLVSHIGEPDQVYHMAAFYDAAVPGVVQVKYYECSDGGSSATIAMQNGDRTIVRNYSNNQAVVTPGTLLTFDTNANTITAGRF